METVEQLESGGDELQKGAAVVMECFSQGDETVQWEDVDHRLTKEQWDELINTGILVDVGAGYRISDVDAVHEIVDSKGPLLSVDDPVETVSWSIFDQLAGVVAVVLFATYSIPEVRNVIGETVNVALNPISQMAPFWVVLVLLGAFTSLYGKMLSWLGIVVRQENIDSVYQIISYKGLLDRFQRAWKAEDSETLDLIVDEQLRELVREIKGVFRVLRQRFQPTVWLMLLGYPLLLWMRWTVRSGSAIQNPSIVFPIVGETYWSAALFGIIPVWLAWYALCSSVLATLLSKGSLLKEL